MKDSNLRFWLKKASVLPLNEHVTFFLDEVYESSNSVIYLAPIIFDAKSLDE